ERVRSDDAHLQEGVRDRDARDDEHARANEDDPSRPPPLREVALEVFHHRSYQTEPPHLARSHENRPAQKHHGRFLRGGRGRWFSCLGVRRRGLEPLRCYPLAPQASASASSATFAWG